MSKERAIWILLIILGAMYVDRKQAEIESLIGLSKINKASNEIKNSQINDMLVDYRKISRSEYDKGFKDGQGHALISIMNQKDILGYKEGYHAGIDEFYKNQDQNILKSNNNSLEAPASTTKY